MERFQKADDISRLKEAFHRVFTKSDPFGNPFQKTLNERVLIFPTNGYYLQENQFHALMKTMEQVGQGTFYVSESEGDSFTLSQDFFSELAPHHWGSENTIAYEDYQSIPLVVENSLYSPHGEWGLQVSHEDHAILAGTSTFIDAFKEAYPEWEEDKEKFLQHWREVNKEFSADSTWIHDFLKQF
ncbi:hypothetical protein [Rossellomorea aquimaris]|uniref:hypothetical protein n=1 Tax=Rossellomorea aquimaris TaxID=189382 RepID=UPI0005C806D8|nr:hypothetical protein [Rossellomorea aquimaris]